MKIKELKINHKWPFNQRIETDSGTVLELVLPFLSSDFEDFDDVLSDKDNKRAYNEFLKIVAGLQVVFNNKKS